MARNDSLNTPELTTSVAREATKKLRFPFVALKFAVVVDNKIQQYEYHMVLN